MPNCSDFEFLGDFERYLSLVRSETNFSEAALFACQHEICVALWGEGNPDISGIGVSIGYGFEVGLGFGLAAAIISIKALNRRSARWRFAGYVLSIAMDAFFNCAIYFALAVELASLVMLVQKDSGISTRAFGANDAQIAIANSVICILPLLYPVALGFSALYRPSLLEQDGATGVTGPSRESARPTSSTVKRGYQGKMEFPENSSSAETRNSRAGVQLMLLWLVALVFIYPFFSQCYHNWGPSRVGGPKGTSLASDAEWGAIEHVCLGDVQHFSSVESTVLAAVELVSSLLVYAFALWQFAVFAVSKLEKMDGNAAQERSATIRRLVHIKNRVKSLRQHRDPNRPAFYSLATATLLLTPLVLSLPLLWGIFRLRDIQGKIVDRLGRQYTGNEWGFGQIIGVAIFAPVFTEACVGGWNRRRLLFEKEAPTAQGRMTDPKPVSTFTAQGGIVCHIVTAQDELQLATTLRRRQIQRSRTM